MKFVAALIVVLGLVLMHAFSGCEKADQGTGGVLPPVASPSPTSAGESNIETSTEKNPESSATPTPKDQFRRMGRTKGGTPRPTEQPLKSKPDE
jgi:hypothetical protein